MKVLYNIILIISLYILVGSLIYLKALDLDDVPDDEITHRQRLFFNVTGFIFTPVIKVIRDIDRMRIYISATRKLIKDIEKEEGKLSRAEKKEIKAMINRMVAENEAEQDLTE